MGQTSPLPTPPPLTDLMAGGPVALFLDFDGTLVELAPSPDAIEVPALLVPRLERLSRRLEGRLALVSGRSLENLADHLGPVALARAGSHGAARKGPDDRWLGEKPAAIPSSVMQEIEQFARANGLTYEPKTHGCALHYRAIPEAGEAAERFMDALSRQHDLEIKRGKCVVEIVRPGANKGGAVRALMARPPFALATPVFIGDDVTDEDGFRASEALGGMGILVGEKPESQARYGLSDVDAVHNWLEIDTE